jgi:hypothetical protein
MKTCLEHKINTMLFTNVSLGRTILSYLNKLGLLETAVAVHASFNRASVRNL